MSNPVTSPWEAVLKQITSPWDWVAGGAGAGIGLGVTIMLHGADLGTSAAAGALAGVTARKALAALLQGRQLSRRAEGLAAEIRDLDPNKSNPALQALLPEIEREHRLWQRKVLSNEQFAIQLDEIVSKYRAVSAGPPSLRGGPGGQPSLEAARDR